MDYFDVRDELPKLVCDGEDEQVQRELVDAFPRAFAFCPSFATLAAMAQRINEATRKRDGGRVICAPKDTPARQLISQIARAQEPVSLAGLSKLNHALKAILSHRHLSQISASLVDYIKEEIGSNGFPENSYVVCLHELNNIRKANSEYSEYDRIKGSFIKKNENFNDQRTFSQAVLSDTELSSHKNHLLIYLEDGYDSGAGSYKVSEKTAREIKKGFQKLAGEFSISEQVDLEALFTFGALSGKRKGHSSRALGPLNGNVIDRA